MSQSDKELLELAAKALGFTLWQNRADAFLLFDGPHLDGDGKFVRFWNPLTDDGDALKLMVKLYMQVDLQPAQQRVVAMWSPQVGRVRYVYDDLNGDPLSATRRAIVRAAAEIGKAVKS